MPKSGDCVVIEVKMGHLGPHSLEAVTINAEAMILAGDLDPLGQQVPNRLIGPSMTEFQLPGLRPQSQGQKLMPQADSECWHRSGDDFQGFNHLFNRGRVAGTV